MDIPTEQASQLLKKYEPVMRFAQGERFFPMNAEDFIGAARLLEHEPRRRRADHLVFDQGPKKDLGNYQRQTYLHQRLERFKDELRNNWLLTLSPKKFRQYRYRRRLRKLVEDERRANVSSEFAYYLQFAQTTAGERAHQALLYALFAILVGFIGFGLYLIGNDMGWLALNIWDIAKVAGLAVAILVWPAFQADRKVHLGIVLNLFALFYYGTIYLVGAGLLGFAVMTGFGFLLWVFRIGHGRFPLFFLHLVSFPVVLAMSWVIGLFFGIGWVFVISMAFLYLLALLSYLLRNNKNILGLKSLANLMETRMNVVSGSVRTVTLVVGVIMIILVVLFTNNTVLSPVQRDALMVSMAANALLWFALDPIDPISIQRQTRKRQIAWSARILRIIFAAIAWNTLTSGLLIYLNLTIFRPDLALLPSDPRNLTGASVTYIFLAISLFFITFIINLLISSAGVGTKAASFILDIFSQQPDTDAIKAHNQYLDLCRTRQEDQAYWYYGRACQDGPWTILQYHYFYAYNDWRSGAEGMNNHEGDWEMAAVFLKYDQPFGIALSQHLHGEFIYWHDLEIVEDTHPAIYVAHGSHANYPHCDIYPTSRQFSGALRRVVSGYESLIEWVRHRTGINVSDDDGEPDARNWGAELPCDNPRKWRDSRQEGGGLEFATGDGLSIGVTGEYPWIHALIGEEQPEWIHFRGLWGQRAGIEGEHGPQGPKWSGEGVRMRWGRAPEPDHPPYYLEWLHILLLDIAHDHDQPTHIRRRALQDLLGENIS